MNTVLEEGIKDMFIIDVIESVFSVRACRTSGAQDCGATITFIRSDIKTLEQIPAVK